MRLGGCVKRFVVILGALMFLFVGFVVVMGFLADDEEDGDSSLPTAREDRDIQIDGLSPTEEPPFDPSAIDPSPELSPRQLSSIGSLRSGSASPSSDSGPPPLGEGPGAFADPDAPAQGPAPTPQADPGQARPVGIDGRRSLFDITYQPNDERQGFKHPEGVIIGLPPFAAPEPVQLQVQQLQLGEVPAEQMYPGTEGRHLLSAYEVTLGKIHRFDQLLSITLPYPEGSTLQDMSAEQITSSLYAVSFNRTTGLWQPEPSSFDQDGITMYLDHLTSVAVAAGGPPLSSNILPVPADADTDGWDQAVEAGWASMTENLGIAGQAGGFAKLVSDLPYLKELNNSLGYLGTATTLMDIAGKLGDGETAQANLSAAKAVLSWAMGKIATTGMQIASLGTFFIDYSLTSLAEGAQGAQEEALSAAYRRYYKEEGWDTATWYREVKGVLYAADSPQAAQSDLKALIDSYTRRIWADEGAFLGYLADIRGHGWTADAGLTNELKTTLEQEYMRELSQTLEPVFLRARSHLQSTLYTQRFRRQMQMEVYLKLPALVWIDIIGLQAGEAAQVALFKGDTPYLRARPSQVNADFYIAIPMQRLLSGDIPDRIKIRLRLQDDGREIVKVYSQPIRFDDDVIDIRFDIDNVYKRVSHVPRADVQIDPAPDQTPDDGADMISPDPLNPEQPDPSADSSPDSEAADMLGEYAFYLRELQMYIESYQGGRAQDTRIMLEGIEEEFLKNGGTQDQLDAVKSQVEGSAQ